MSLLEAAVLGIVQGITEFLPISSSGHLIVVPQLFGWQEGGLGFDTMIHVATFLAVLVAFRTEVVRMVRGVCGVVEDRAYGRLAWMLVAATVPVVLVGLLVGELELLRTVPVVAVSLIVWGVVLAAADRLARVRGARVQQETQVGWSQALGLGVAQVLALIPGTSRSGVTMSTALLAGMDRVAAARFSFLMSLPAVGGAGAYVVLQAVRAGEPLLSVPLLVGFVCAFLSGLAAIRVLLAVVQTWSFLPFALYRIGLGVVLLLWFV